MILIVYAISAFGLAYIVGHAVISRPIRRALFDTGNPFAEVFVDLLECPACLGFWIGLVAGLLFEDVIGWGPGVLSLFTSGSNYLLGRATGLITNPNEE